MLRIPDKLANTLFDIDDEQFEILSELSEYDQDFYFGAYLFQLKRELKELSKQIEKSSQVEPILSIIDEAIELDIAVLFDPFRDVFCAK